MEFKLLQPKMTTQDQIIIICVLAFIAAPLGTFISIKTINKLTRPPVNTLTTTTGDIELGHYIEPMRPPHSYQPIDSLNYEPYNWDERVPSFFTGEYPPSYYSGGNPPSFNSINRVYCPLEDYINLDYILWIILFSVFLLLIWIYFMKNIKIEQNIILLLGLSIIYFQFSLLIQLIFLIIVFFLSNFLLGINPDNIQFKVIRAITFIVILLTFNNSLYNMCILFPFSFYEIDYRDSFEWKFDSYKVKPMISYLKIQTLTKDIINLLYSLNDDKYYSMSLSFISSYEKWVDDKQNINPIFVENAIIINKESDPILITEFILNSLDDKKLFITNWLKNDYSINTMDPQLLVVTVPIKVEF